MKHKCSLLNTVKHNNHKKSTHNKDTVRVIPMKMGIQIQRFYHWIPAFAGMTSIMRNKLNKIASSIASITLLKI